MTKSVTFTERQALRQYVDYIMDERERLMREYITALDRIAKLDEIEGVRQHNKATNIELSKELSSSNKVSEQSKSTKPSEDEPMFAKPKRFRDTPSGQRIYNKAQAEEYKDKDKTNGPIKYRSRRRDLKKVSFTILSILKENGDRMALKDILRELSKRDIPTYQPHIIMQSVMKYQPSVKRLGRGHYIHSPKLKQKEDKKELQLHA